MTYPLAMALLYGGIFTGLSLMAWHAMHPAQFGTAIWALRWGPVLCVSFFVHRLQGGSMQDLLDYAERRVPGIEDLTVATLRLGQAELALMTWAVWMAAT